MAGGVLWWGGPHGPLVCGENSVVLGEPLWYGVLPAATAARQ